MLDEKRILELINKSIDGVASAREEAALRKLVEENPDVRHLHVSLSKLSTALRTVRSAEPPINLRQRILSSIPTAREPQSARRTSIVDRVGFSRLFVRHRVAYTFVGGLAIGMLVIAFVLGPIIKNSTFDVTHVYGTMVGRESLDRATPIDKATIFAVDISGTIRLTRDGDLVLADLAIDAQNTSDVHLRFDPNVLEFTGYRQLDGKGTSVTSGVNQVSLAVSGPNRTVFMFTHRSDEPVSLQCTVLRESRPLFEQTLLGTKN
jgi:hypothetical protein